MSKKDDFKKFVSNRPQLSDYVKKHNVSWQSLFELYDLYGEKESVWEKYLTTEASSSINIKSILNSLKNINVDSLEENISSIQKAAQFVEELTKPSKEEKDTTKSKEEKIERFYSD